MRSGKYQVTERGAIYRINSEGAPLVEQVKSGSIYYPEFKKKFKHHQKKNVTGILSGGEIMRSLPYFVSNAVSVARLRSGGDFNRNGLTLVFNSVDY